MSITRRQFLGMTGIAGAAGLVSSSVAQAQEHFTGWPDRHGVLTDLTVCNGCRKCEEACANVSNLPPPDPPPEDKSVFETLRRTNSKTHTVVNRFPNLADPDGLPIYVKKQCMHCNEPACASSCLVSAFSKTPEGAVSYNASVCIGCRYCMTACPFYIPTYEYDEPLKPRVMKCTMCHDRVKEEGKLPGCVEVCPVQALTFGKRTDLIRLARERIIRNPDRYIDHIYGEHEVGGTSWMYITGVPFERLGFDMDLGITPYPEFTRGFLSAVPLVLTLWPVFFTGVYLFSRRRNEIAKEEGDSSHEEEIKS